MPYLVHPVFAQDYNFRLCIEGIQYKSIRLFGENMEGQAANIQGSSTDGYNWNFTIPDSVYNSVPYFAFSPEGENEEPNTVHRIYFLSKNDADTLIYGDTPPLERKFNKVHVQYMGTQVYENRLFIKAGSQKKSEDVYFANLHQDRLLIQNQNNPEYIMQAQYADFSRFTSKEEYSYDDYINQYLAIINKYPESRYLIVKVATSLQKYQTKADLQKIYNAFSEVNKQTNWGKIIQDYLKNHFVFSNTILPTWNTGVLEPIIKDSTKINLVVFSASWCAPCHKQIPILKEIYSDLKDFIIITYVSIDEEKYVNNWRKLMKKENIPWRGLLAANDLKAIKERYDINEIPYTLLVYPSGKVESIDVRNLDEKEKLYRFLKKQ
jgi:thiol-disulfide isomerase/thioredoxin